MVDSRIAPKPRVAIVGGGPAGLSAAFHLVCDPNWQQKIASITVYQLGWRVGGKGATGRNEDRGSRIEEHGIHGFCSFYFNTWRMMQEVYATLHADDRACLPTKTIDEAFRGSSIGYTIEMVDRQWTDATDYRPHTSGDPWDNQPLHFTWWDVAMGLVRQMLLRGRRGGDGDEDHFSYGDLVAPSSDEELVQRVKALHEDIKVVRNDIVAVNDATSQLLIQQMFDQEMARLNAHRPTIASIITEAERTRDESYRSTVTTLDFYLALLRGLYEEKFWQKAFDLDRLDDEDFRHWLHKYGASDLTLASPIALAVPNILFAYDEGDTTRAPVLSTASWLNWVLRSVVGKGEYFYFMAAGTGDSVMLPLYLWLRRRGVRFELFHKLVNVVSGKDQSGATVLEKLVFEQQATTLQANYKPLVTVTTPSGVTFDAWPNQPNWAQLVDGPNNKKLGVNYEDWATQNASGSKAHALGRGAKDGFEHVVWAMPPSMIGEVGDSTLKSTWSDITSKLHMTATQAVQIWLAKDTEDLGWPRTNLKPATARYACASYPNPLNAAVAFDDVIAFEAWPEPPPKGLVYFCAQMQRWPDPQNLKEDETRVRQALGAAVRVLGNFLRKARPQLPARPDPQTIDFNLLYDLRPGGFGEVRLDAQYVRANTGPHQVYVQAHPKSVGGRRLAWDTEYANVVVAGDWTYTGFNLGAFESAVTGGKIAAFALTIYGSPDYLVGLDFFHPKAAQRLSDALAKGVIPIVT